MAHQCKLETTSPREKGDDFHFHIPYIFYNLKDKGHKTEEWDSNYPWHQKILILVSLKIKIISPKTCMKTHGKEDASFFLKFWSGGWAFEPGDSNRPTPKASALSRCLLGEKGGEWIVILHETVIVQMIQLNLATFLN